MGGKYAADAASRVATAEVRGAGGGSGELLEFPEETLASEILITELCMIGDPNIKESQQVKITVAIPQNKQKSKIQKQTTTTRTTQ